ncbi:MAG: LLM class F420-dependent oxidoreductase [Dehalococcoidia bacterium]
MEVGLHIPQVGRASRPDVILPLARAADEAGFDGLWVFDHVVIQKEQGSQYPYSPDGRLGFNPHSDFLEPLTLLSYVAAVTAKVRLGTSVLVLPMRQPVLNAKILASIDKLSGGRVVLGGGVGWWKEEFEVLGVPFERRGARMDEYLQLIRALWTDDWVNFRGEFYECVDWTCNPKPVNGTIPIWLGGESRQQLHRIGRFADGWLATARSLEYLERDFAIARGAAAQAGRDPDALVVAIEGAGVLASEGMEQLADSLTRLAERGVAHAILIVNPREYEQAPAIIHTFAKKHLPAIHAAGASRPAASR